MDKNSKVNLLLIKIGIAGIVIILIFIATAIYKETSQKKQIQAEINKLRDEASRINKENSVIQEKIAYFESTDYMEKEAKDKLNLQSPDEQVIVVKPSSAKNIVAIKENRTGAAADPRLPEVANNVKWWTYFFKY